MTFWANFFSILQPLVVVHWFQLLALVVAISFWQTWRWVDNDWILILGQSTACAAPLHLPLRCHIWIVYSGYNSAAIFSPPSHSHLTKQMRFNFHQYCCLYCVKCMSEMCASRSSFLHFKFLSAFYWLRIGLWVLPKCLSAHSGGTDGELQPLCYSASVDKV